MIAVINTVTPEPCELQQNSPEGQPGGQTLVVHVLSCPSSFRSLVVEIVLVVSLMAFISSVSSAAESWWRVPVAEHVTWCCK